MPYTLKLVLDVVSVLNRFIENTNPRKISNLLLGGAQFAMRKEKVHSWPAVLKIDISPLCSLRCTICVHADANGNEALERQSFNSKQKMTVEQFNRIVDEVKGKTGLLSLYYLGDPLMHPELDEMCAIARRARINTHVSTHFSYALSDERLKRLVESGLTYLTVCVDGMTQEKYELTRIGGKLDRVLSNLRRVCQYRKELKQVYPRVDVQFIKFQHNVDDLEAARNFCEEIGVDQFTDFWGYLNNWTDVDPGTYEVFAPKRSQLLPRCFMPHFMMVIKYNGDVIPCCYYRLGKQYTGSEESKAIGNVFKTSVWDVWNSQEYRLLRRIVSNPEKVDSDPELKDIFCSGCPLIFDTNAVANVRRGDEYAHRDMYTIGNTGRPVRKG
jgi:MoaA/NifB/PqqE/SkfB family radical SAM enzyme